MATSEFEILSQDGDVNVDEHLPPHSERVVRCCIYLEGEEKKTAAAMRQYKPSEHPVTAREQQINVAPIYLYNIQSNTVVATATAISRRQSRFVTAAAASQLCRIAPPFRADIRTNRAKNKLESSFKYTYTY